MQKPTLQKVLILIALGSIGLTNGLIFGLTSGMISSLKKKEDGIIISDRGLQFIVCGGMHMANFGFMFTTISDKIGRRWPLLISSVAVAVHWVITYYAQNILHFTISRIIVGVAIGTRFSLNILSTSEYTSPQTRALFLNIITTVAPSVGTLWGHYFGTIYHWRSTALMALFPTLMGVIIPYFCVESPHWLASKGRFQECEESFRKLHGINENSEIELQMLIKMEKCKKNRAEDTKITTVRKKFLLTIKKKYVWKLILLSLALFSYLASCGKFVFTILATTLLEDITGTPNVLLYTMLIDIFFVSGSCLSCILIRKMTMRNVLFTTGYTANAILVILSACLYFGPGIEYLRWVTVTLLAVYFILIEAGPSPVLEALMGEIYPLEIKMSCFFIVGCILPQLMALSTILLPILSAAIGYHGLFLLNASTMSLSLAFIWLSLPETKGRTLQEIEVYFKTKSFDVDEVIKDEQMNELI